MRDLWHLALCGIASNNKIYKDSWATDMFFFAWQTRLVCFAKNFMHTTRVLVRRLRNCKSICQTTALVECYLEIEQHTFGWSWSFWEIPYACTYRFALVILVLSCWQILPYYYRLCNPAMYLSCKWCISKYSPKLLF